MYHFFWGRISSSTDDCKHQSHENVTSAKKSKFEIIGDNSSQNVRSWSSLYIAAAGVWPKKYSWNQNFIRQFFDCIFWFIHWKKRNNNKSLEMTDSYSESDWMRVSNMLSVGIGNFLAEFELKRDQFYYLLRQHVRGFILIVKFRVWLDIGQLLPYTQYLL